MGIDSEEVAFWPAKRFNWFAVVVADVVAVVVAVVVDVVAIVAIVIIIDSALVIMGNIMLEFCLLCHELCSCHCPFMPSDFFRRHVEWISLYNMYNIFQRRMSTSTISSIIILPVRST